MPDFDIDFCQDRRDEVIDYVQNRYGRDAGRADHHLRHAAGEGRAARRRPRAGNAVRARRQAVQAGAAEPGGAGHARQGDRRRAALAGRARQRSARQARVRYFAQARGSLPPRLDARRRHRDRRPSAGGAGADVPRSEVRHAGHPVQHEMGGSGGTGEVRLPRPQDAHGAGHRREAAQAAQHRPRSCRDPARRQENLRPAVPRRSGRHLPTGKSGHAPRAARHAAGPLRGHHRAGRALPARPDGEHPDLLRTQARPREAGIHPSQARTGPARDVRRHRLSGTGDAGGAAPRRLHARPSRPAAPRDGQEDPLGDAGAAQAFRARRDRARHRPQPGRRDLRSAGALRRIRLQQEPRRRLCAGRLSDRVHEGELSGRIPRRVDGAGNEQHRQALGVSRRGRAARHQAGAAMRQPLRRCLRCRRQHHSLRAGRAQRRRRAGGAVDRRGEGHQAVHRPRRLRAAYQSARREQARAGKPRRLGRVRPA